MLIIDNRMNPPVPKVPQTTPTKRPIHICHRGITPLKFKKKCHLTKIETKIPVASKRKGLLHSNKTNIVMEHGSFEDAFATIKRDTLASIQAPT